MAKRGGVKSGAPNRSHQARTNYKHVAKPGLAGSMAPAKPLNPSDMPVSNIPPATDARWGHEMGVPMRNPDNPYEGGDEVNG